MIGIRNDPETDGGTHDLLEPSELWRVHPGLDPDRFDLISTDLFDTLLLRRRGWPDEVLRTVGLRARACGWLDPGMTPVLFAALRVRAGDAAEAEAGPGRATLADIYRHLPADLIDIPRVQALEVETEAEGIVINPFLASLIRHLVRLGRPVIAASDMYLGRSELCAILSGAGLDAGFFTRLYVSCEEGASKRDGSLFRKILADHPGLAPDRICHIGDDPIADGIAPARLGIATFDYAIPAAMRRLEERERLVGQALGLGRVSAPCDPARALAARLLPSLRSIPVLPPGPSGGDDADFWSGFGSLVLAPVLVRYCVFVVEECQRLGIERIVAFMREGRLLARLMAAWAALRGYRITIETLAVSRLALGLTEAPRWDRTALLDLFERRPYLRLGDLLARAGDASAPDTDLGIGTGADAGTDTCAGAGAGPSRPHLPEGLGALADLPLETLVDRRLADGTPVMDAVIGWFQQPERVAALEARAAHARRLTERTLAAAFGSASSVALVDLGARATTAGAIHRLVRSARTDAASAAAGGADAIGADGLRSRPRLRAFLLYATEPVTRALESGLAVSLFAGEDNAALALGRLLYRSPQPIERLLTGLDDCTVGYRETKDGTVVPVQAPTRAVGPERAALRAVEDGVMHYWQCFAALEGMSGSQNCIGTKKGGSGAGQAPDQGAFRGAEAPRDLGTTNSQGAFAPRTPQLEGLAGPPGPPSFALLPWLGVLHLPLPEEAACLGRLRYDYNDSSAWVRTICDQEALAAVRPLLSGGSGPLVARLLGLRPRHAPWPQGAATMLDPDALFRHHDALVLDPGHRAACAALVRRMKAGGVTRTVVFAAGGPGGMGAAFIAAARDAGVEVTAYLDHFSHAVADTFCGVPVIRLEELTDPAPWRGDPIALVTLGYREPMLAGLRRVLGDEHKEASRVEDDESVDETMPSGKVFCICPGGAV